MPERWPAHRREAALAVAQQQQAAARVIARNLDLVGEEVLAQEHVLASVAVVVRDAGVEGRRELRLARQRHRLEALRPD